MVEMQSTFNSNKNNYKSITSMLNLRILYSAYYVVFFVFLTKMPDFFDDILLRFCFCSSFIMYPMFDKFQNRLKVLWAPLAISCYNCMNIFNLKLEV